MQDGWVVTQGRVAVLAAGVFDFLDFDFDFDFLIFWFFGFYFLMQQKLRLCLWSRESGNGGIDFGALFSETRGFG